MRRLLTLLLVLVGMLATVSVSYVTSPGHRAVIDRALAEGPSHVEMATQSVVKIETENALGAGVIIAKEGYILTNAHVVADADEVKVFTKDGEERKGLVMWTSKDKYDTALVRIMPDAGLHAASLSCAPVKPGDEVFAVGHPLGAEWSATFGRVSAVRAIKVQLDATLLPGNSGGGLFNEDGDLIGLPQSLALWGVSPFAPPSPTGQTYAISNTTLCTLLGRT